MFPLPMGMLPKDFSLCVRDKHLWDKTAGKRTVILEDRNRACVYSCIKCSLGTLKVTCQEEQGWVQVNEKRIMRITAQIYGGMVLFRAP